jgi:hypothetical protein
MAFLLMAEMNRFWNGGNQERRTVSGAWGCYNSCPRRINVELGSCSPAVKEGTESSITRNQTTGRGFEGAEWSRRARRNYHKSQKCSGVAPETKNPVSSGAQTNRRSPARSLGEMEGGTTPQVSPIRPFFPQFHSQIFRFHAENYVDIDEVNV